MVVVVTRTGSRSLATTAANRSRSVPWDTLVTVTLVYGSNRFGLVRTEELEHRTISVIAKNRKGKQRFTSWQAHPGHI